MEVVNHKKVKPESSTRDTRVAQQRQRLDRSIFSPQTVIPKELLDPFLSAAPALPEALSAIFVKAKKMKPRMFLSSHRSKPGKGYDTTGAIIIVANTQRTPEGYNCRDFHYTRFPEIKEAISLFMQLNPQLNEEHATPLAKIAIRANDRGLWELSWAAVQYGLGLDSSQIKNTILKDLEESLPPVSRERPEGFVSVI